MRQDEGVQIIELGMDPLGEPPLQRADQPVGSLRKRVVVGGLVMAGLFAGAAFLASNNDSPPPEEASNPQTTTEGDTVPAIPDACNAIEQAMQAGESSRTNPPSGYSWYAAATPERTVSDIGLVHPDGSIQLCEESAREVSLNIQFPTEADLGKLPENLTYAYTSAEDVNNDGLLSLALEGVRLPDGLVVDSLTLAGGRVVPVNSLPGS